MKNNGKKMAKMKRYKMLNDFFINFIMKLFIICRLSGMGIDFAFRM